MRRTKGFILDSCILWILHHDAGIVCSTKLLCIDSLGAGRALDPQTHYTLVGRFWLLFKGAHLHPRNKMFIIYQSYSKVSNLLWQQQILKPWSGPTTGQCNVIKATGSLHDTAAGASCDRRFVTNSAPRSTVSGTFLNDIYGWLMSHRFAILETVQIDGRASGMGRISNRLN